MINQSVFSCLFYFVSISSPDSPNSNMRKLTSNVTICCWLKFGRYNMFTYYKGGKQDMYNERAQQVIICSSHRFQHNTILSATFCHLTTKVQHWLFYVTVIWKADFLSKIVQPNLWTENTTIWNWHNDYVDENNKINYQLVPQNIFF